MSWGWFKTNILLSQCNEFCVVKVGEIKEQKHGMMSALTWSSHLEYMSKVQAEEALESVHKNF